MDAVQGLFSFIGASPTPFHAVDEAKRRLLRAGYTQLEECELWRIFPGERCFVMRGGSSIAAFTVPQAGWGALKLAVSHSDSPALKIKPHGAVKANGATRLNVEIYGGMLQGTWFDRPLGVAGRLLVKTQDGAQTHLVDAGRDLVIIPSVAIHLNREANKGYAYNAHVDLPALYGGEDAQEVLSLLARGVQAGEKDVLAADLLIYNRMAGTLLGAQKEFIAAPRLDDLECAYCTLESFLTAEHCGLNVWAMLDNEEVGSVTKQGACSTFLADVLERLCLALGGTREEYHTSLAGSFLISADNAHAQHPNHAELADALNAPRMNGGVVVKYNAQQKYTTDASSAALFGCICEKASVPVQTFANRADLAGGSTLGNLSNTQISLNAVDIGLAQLAMHSAYETAGAQDIAHLTRAVRAFYESEILLKADGAFTIHS